MFQDTTRLVVDTVYLPAPISAADSVYLEILAKTNQQLGLWTNPYGLLVGALAVLVAVFAIVAAVVVWRQGSDYRRLIEGQIKDQWEVLNSLVHERLEAIQVELNSELERATGENKERIEEKLREIERQKQTLHGQSAPAASVRANLGLGGLLTTYPATVKGVRKEAQDEGKDK